MVELGQLYFILQVEKLRSTLSGEDMAALAVKASLVISSPTKSQQRVNSIFQAMPMTEADELEDYKRINEFSICNLSTKRKLESKSDPSTLSTLTGVEYYIRDPLTVFVAVGQSMVESATITEMQEPIVNLLC
ncbi:uncharacterized protein A4U43_C05F15680 [Asparagus officinalis]|uniref:Uncharacterized protein n=1 Tax=Asparagus officinalis TaxID=4686 RepID=A0A5P1EW84_ASPOF|nr:uncharacterized protein A4U43_C05F15680 [Asparagus officinalis]